MLVRVDNDLLNTQKKEESAETTTNILIARLAVTTLRVPVAPIDTSTVALLAAVALIALTLRIASGAIASSGSS